jgi:hypothetical protein
VATGDTLLICTPSYTSARYIDGALANVALQHPERAKLVVTDHGSESTVDLLREAASPRVVAGTGAAAHVDHRVLGTVRQLAQALSENSR